MKKKKVDTVPTDLCSACDVPGRSDMQAEKLVDATRQNKLHTTCFLCIWGGIPTDKLRQAIARLPKLHKQVTALRGIKHAFTELVGAFRELNTNPIWRDGAVIIYFPLIETAHILGFRYQKPTAFNETQHICDELGIGTFYAKLIGGALCVPDEDIRHIIRKAGFPKEITRRLMNWFDAFVLERKHGAGWDGLEDK